MGMSAPAGVQSFAFYTDEEVFRDYVVPGVGPASSTRTAFDGKLEGQHSWSFSKVPLSSVILHAKKLKTIEARGNLSLPRSLSEGDHSGIRYELEVKVKRTGLLKRDERFASNPQRHSDE